MIDLSHSGTAPVAWHDTVAQMSPWSIDRVRHRRLVVVAPHPDDETLGVGGIIAEANAAGLPVAVISVTDGEAASNEFGLGNRRHAELLAALDCLAPGGVERVVRCRLPDGGVATHRDELDAILAAETRAGDLLMTPLHCDGHPDHDAVGDAAAVLAYRPEIDVVLFPIWAWHWHEPSLSIVGARGRRFDLSPVAALAKERALACYTSQTSGDDPVLPNHFFGRFNDPHEVVVPLIFSMSA